MKERRRRADFSRLVRGGGGGRGRGEEGGGGGVGRRRRDGFPVSWYSYESKRFISP